MLVYDVTHEKKVLFILPQMAIVIMDSRIGPRLRE